MRSILRAPGTVRKALLALASLLPFAGPARAEDEAPTPDRIQKEPERIQKELEAIQKEEDAVLRLARGFERSIVRVVKKIRPTTVAIENWREQPVGLGSGVVISADGYVLTNYHVIKGARRIVVVLEGGERLDATRVGSDERGDISLLKVSVKKRLKYTNPKRDVSRKLAEGAWVLALGNPFQLGADGQPVVTLGVVSGLGRVTGGEFMYGDSIQHDAEINPGNSGGPLFDLDGSLIGINGRIAASTAGGGGPSNSGVGYAIPMHQVQNFLDKLIEGGSRTRHGDEIVGLEVASASDDEGQPIGVRVESVSPSSPAATTRGGMLKDDVIWKINTGGKTTEVANQTQYLNVMSTLAEGARVALYVRREKRSLVFRLVLDDTWARGEPRR